MNEPAAQPLEIFIPFWGKPEYLYATVRSVLAQTNDSWTLTVVDDCYPDESVAAYFHHISDTRIIYQRNEANLGTTGNYERCRSMASGDLLMFLGCDDLLQPQFVETIHRVHSRFPDAAVIQVGVDVIDDTGAEISPLTDKVKRAIMPRVDGATQLHGEELATSLLRGDWLYWPSLVFRTESLRRYAFRDALPIIQDLALMIDMAAGGESLVLEPKRCFSYRRHTQSVSASGLLHGSRFADERRYYGTIAAELRAHGWQKAARTATVRWTSRLHALTLLPSAVRGRHLPQLRGLLGHAFGR